MPASRPYRRTLPRVGRRAALLAGALASLPLLVWLLAGQRPEPPARMLERAAAARKVHQNDGALSVLHTLLATWPGDPLAPKARLLLAETAVEAAAEAAPDGTPAALAAAARACDEAAAAGVARPDLGPVRVSLGRALGAAGDWNGAARQLELALAGDTGFSPILLELSRAYALRAPPDPTRSLAALERYAAGAKGDDQVIAELFARGAILVLLGRPADAGDVYRSIADQFPSSAQVVRAQVEAGRAHLAAGRWADAAADLARARLFLGGTAEGQEVILLQARARRGQGEPAAALADLAAIPRGEPTGRVTDAWLLEAACRLDLGDASAALRAFQEAAAAPPPEAADLAEVGRDLDRLGHLLPPPEGIRAWLAVAPRLLAALPAARARIPLLQAFVPAALELGAEAERYAERARRGRDPEAAAAAHALAAQGFEVAANALEALEPQLPAPTGSGGWALAAADAHLRAGHPLLAVVAVRRYLTLCLSDDPRQAEGLWLLGSCLRALGRDEEAEAAFVRCAADHPGAFPFGSQALLDAGRCRRAVGDPAGAARRFAALLDRPELAPESPIWKAALVEAGAALLASARLAGGGAGTGAGGAVLSGPDPGARRLLEALERYPDDCAVAFRANAELGLSAVEAGDLVTAEARLLAAATARAQLGPDAETDGGLSSLATLDLPVALALADVRLLQGEPDAAAEAYRAVARAHPDLADAVGTRALAGLLKALDAAGRAAEAQSVARAARPPAAAVVASGAGPEVPLIATLRAEVAADLRARAAGPRR